MAKRKGLSRSTALLICILLLIVVELVFGFADVWYFAILRFVVCGIFDFCIYKGLQQETIVNAYFLFSLTPLSPISPDKSTRAFRIAEPVRKSGSV